MSSLSIGWFRQKRESIPARWRPYKRCRALQETDVQTGMDSVGYVVGFASMEPVLSAQVTRHAHSLVRGTAAGVFNTVQFFGVFLGGLLAGLALKFHLESAFFLTVAAAQLPWLLIAWRIPKGKVEEESAA